MSFVALRLLLVSMSTVAFTQSVPGAAGSLEGRVQNFLTGDPIAGAGVTLTCLSLTVATSTCEKRSTVARPDGSFAFDTLFPGKYLVSGNATGFVLMPVESLVVALIEAGRQASPVVIKLAPEAIIAGKVVDEAGTPLTGVSVQALAVRVLSGHTRISQSTRATTDKSGAYSLNRLSPGSYLISAQSPEAVHFFYPGALTTDQATSVLVEPGQSYDGINIRVRAVATYRIQGIVADFANLDATLKSQLHLQLASEAQTLPAGDNIRVASDGSFSVTGVVPGNYVLRLSGVSTSMHLLAQQQVGVGNGNVSGVVLSIPAPIGVSGHVLLAESSAAVNLAQTQISLRPLDAGGTDYKTTKPQADGSFQFSPCDAARYAVRVAAPSGLYVQSVEFNRQDVLSHAMDLSSGTGGELVVTLGVGSATVNGALPADQQLQLSTYVFLIPSNWNPDISGDLTPRLARNGTFSFRDVAPGRYVMVALEWTDSNHDLWRSPEFIQALQGEGVAVEVKPADRLQETVPLLTDADIRRLLGRLGLH